MLSIFKCDGSTKLIGSRWIPASAGMTDMRVPAFAGMTSPRALSPAMTSQSALTGTPMLDFVPPTKVRTS
ncbi:MAG TPA: hypothetical protein VLI40_01650 [Gemmatimonadaceae bacterium]|nr:hypothetical protein [Gemmatimonadaceae bacterium]